MTGPRLESLSARIAGIAPVYPVGRVTALNEATLQVAGFAADAALGDQVEIRADAHAPVGGEIIRIDRAGAVVLPGGDLAGVALGDPVALRGPALISPDDSWIGRVIDPMGRPLDGRALLPGPEPRDMRAPPPLPADRRGLGERIETGFAAFNTLLPIVRGQRIGLFAGSGVGKSTLIGGLARRLDADVTVIALIGERGREVGHFVHQVLGAEGMSRAVVVAATSDQSPLNRRRCAWSAMAVAEHFRDRGRQVLFIADSITRFADAHREVALAAGETPTLHGYPATLAHQVMALAERAGPGSGLTGDITAVFSVLVAGSDMEGPVADIIRGVLDGHVVLDRRIAERGRYPAIDLLRSVSRSLPDAASPEENRLIGEARRLLGAYERAELMIQSGLYATGHDPVTDRAIRCQPALDAFLARNEDEPTAVCFAALRAALGETAPA